MMAHRHTAVTISDRESAYTMDCLWKSKGIF
jgi:hypothetical protein